MKRRMTGRIVLVAIPRRKDNPCKATGLPGWGLLSLALGCSSFGLLSSSAIRSGGSFICSPGGALGWDGCSDDGIAISGGYYRSIDTAMARDTSGEQRESKMQRTDNEGTADGFDTLCVMRRTEFDSAGFGEACRGSNNLAGLASYEEIISAAAVVAVREFHHDVSRSGAAGAFQGGAGGWTRAKGPQGA